MMIIIPDPWWVKDHYDVDETVPLEMEGHAGPHGVAMVKLWGDGRTSKGWGKTDENGELSFVRRYSRGMFNPKALMQGYEQDRWAVSFVMRSVSLVAIDIDGKNGGVEHAEELLLGAPPTLAETSKSGKGFHLFYSVDDDWGLEDGFGLVGDFNGVVQGVDIRGTGCIHHHKQQRWNGREVAPLPEHILTRLKEKKERRNEAMETITKTVEGGDSDELLILQHELLSDLKKPIQPGMRNTTLFAIGSKLHAAKTPGWEERLRERGEKAGLPDDEINKIISNIIQYNK